MSQRAQNVISLHQHRGPPEDLSVPLERLGIAARELGDLSRCVERVVAETQCSTAEWGAACTPLMLRLPGARQSLADLAEIRADRWPDTEWAVRFCAVCDEAERRLLSVSVAMRSLVHGEITAMDLLVSFRFDGAKLVEAVNELCRLITSQYPEAVDRI